MNSNVSSLSTRTSTASALSAWRRSRYGFALFFALSLVAVFSALRALLFLQFKPDAALSTADVAGTFLHGLERDVFVALLYTLPLLFWFLILRERWFITHWQRLLLRAGLFVFWFVQVFLLIAEYYFFDEFRSRFNTVAVDYLLYPHEVFINIWDSYPVPAVLAGCAALSAAWVVVAFQLFRHAWVETARLGTRFLAFCGALALCAALASTINLKGAHFSTDRTLNEIADNGAIAFAAAWWTGNLDYGAYYKTMGKDEAYQRARRLLAEPGSQFTEENNSIRRRVNGSPPAVCNIQPFMKTALTGNRIKTRPEGAGPFALRGRHRGGVDPDIALVSHKIRHLLQIFQSEFHPATHLTAFLHRLE